MFRKNIRKLDHYIRVGLPQQIYDNYEALLVRIGCHQTFH